MVNCVLQDQQGFLWIGTQNGVFRYDGQDFTAFHRGNGLPDEQVEAMHEAPDGTLWVATVAGLARRVGEGFQALPIAGVGDPAGLTAIESDDKGRLFIGTDRGLLLGEPTVAAGGFRFHRLPNPGSGQRIHGLTVDATGTIWYGCGSNICRFKPGGEGPLAEADAPGGPWESFAFDITGRLWVRSRTALLVRQAGGGRFTEVRDERLTPAAVGQVLAGRNGEVFVATERGLALFSRGRWKRSGTYNRASSGTIRCLFQDREGSIWLGMNGQGLLRWLGYGAWASWNEVGGLPSHVVWAIQRDRAGQTWVGTQRGLAVLERSEESWRARPDVLGNRSIRGLGIAPDGRMWAAFSGGGAARFQPKGGGVEKFGPAEGLPAATATAAHVDGLGGVWIATWLGLYHMPPGAKRFERAAVAGETPGERYYTMALDPRGRVWAGGTHGLVRFEGGKWTRWTARDGLNSNRVGQLAVTGNGELWIGYRDAVGFSRTRVQGDTLQTERFGLGAGLRSEKSILIGVDARQWVWLGSDNGVDVHDGKQWRHFGSGNGLIWDDCNTQAFLADPDGGVWIGTSKGLSHFHPDDGAAAQPRLPQPVITSIRMGAKAQPLEEAVSGSWKERAVRLTFSGLVFQEESAVRFRYRMAGLEEQWHETRVGEASYAALPAGDFEFQLQARALDLGWTPQPTVLRIHVDTPWWQQIWIRVLSLVGCLAAVRYLLARRVQRMREVQTRLEVAVEDRTATLREQMATVERQKVEIERLLRDAQVATRFKSEFLANVSHEIRTPMNGIIGLTDLVLSSELPPEQVEFVRLLRASADSLLNIINDILDFSKVEAGKLELETVTFRLHELVRDTFGPLKLVAEQKGLACDYTVDESLPPVLAGDPVRLRQVIVNLLTNATKFTESGGILLTIGAESRDSRQVMLHFAVSDTGIGIPADKLDMVFEPFRQADGSTSRRFGGTGLGLAISTQLVQLMGGKIWAESEVGTGSTFHFTAQLEVAEDSGREAEPEPPLLSETSSSQWRILLAEDNEVNQRLARTLLERRGHTVVAAGNGLDALKLLQSGGVDLVLMDVQMPTLDGIEATRRWRERERETGGHVPIVAMTANAMKGDRERCLGAGMDGYVAKPVRPAVLFAEIEGVMAAAADPPLPTVE